MQTLSQLSLEFFQRLSGNGTTDELCLKKSLERFLASGKKEDAFVVYFCFSEIFKLFGNGYDNTQKLLETLSDHEYHTGELLTKHRDHYSHSVYVFALGLALYANDEITRKAFLGFYNYNDGVVSDRNFLRLWGMTALFHDIGYPFQLAHEQVKIYCEELWGRKNPCNPYVSFGNMTALTATDGKTEKKLQKTLGVSQSLSSLDELLAYGLKLRMGYDEKNVCQILRERVERQPNFMDHGYFSAIILARRLLSAGALDTQSLDVLTAILLHNSFNKYDAPERRPVSLDEHPLAYLLILCDELQAWDRLAYGKASKRDPIGWEILLSITDGNISAEYLFEARAIDDGNGKTRLNKSFAEIESGEFKRNIESFIISSHRLNITASEKSKTKKYAPTASDDNFINLCDFAKAIHASYNESCTALNSEQINMSFAELPLEFKVSNIEQAKTYAEKLDLINCFYSSKDFDYPVVADFAELTCPSGNALDFLCREEHVRWVKEKLDMGWSYGTDYSSVEERNRKKIHKDIAPYDVLPESEKKKDGLMINNIIPLLNRFGSNIRIYNCITPKKPDLEIAGTGHRFFKGDRDKIKAEIKGVLARYSEKYRVIVRTCYAYGADQLIAECATELGLTTKAVIPTEYEKYISVVKADCANCGHEFTQSDELKMRALLAQTAVCKVITDDEQFYLGASKRLINNCDKLIAIWDGKTLPLTDAKGNPLNRGGTYDCIRMAKDRGLSEKDIHIIKCTR